MSKNIRALSARHKHHKTLFEQLTEASKANGCLSESQLKNLSAKNQIPVAHLLATSSFYDFLNEQNYGKRAYICSGTSCLMKGRQQTVRTALLRKYKSSEIGEMKCLGHCYRGDAFIENNQVLDASQYYPGEKKHENDIPFYCLSAVSVFSGEITDLQVFYQSVLVDKENISRQLEDSKLRGRGGAGFVFAKKLIACANADGEQKYIVCNADEGDPGAFSDRYLMEVRPHLILAGMLASGYACGADSGYIYIRAEYPLSQLSMQQAIGSFETTDVYKQTGFKFHIISGAGSYICGEETALLNSIEGLKPEVRTRPPYPAEQGLFSKPTLLSNVETFAAIPWIINRSGSEFAKMGTDKSSGTKLVCLDHGFKHPGVYEVAMGQPMQTLIEAAGGFLAETKAIQVGGPLGSVVPLKKLSKLNLDFESFDQQGFLLGHAGMIAIPESFEMIDFMRHLFEFMADESCGKCLPCRLGTKKGYQLLRAASQQSPIDVNAFNELLDALQLGSLCGLGSGLPLPVRNIMSYFENELADYFSGESVV